MPENTKTKDQSPTTIPRFVWVAFAIIIVAVYFFGLTVPLLGPDEPRYAQIAREMFERGDWITPKLGGFDWFEKPALLYWLQIVFFKIFGVSEFAARFGSALFGLGTIFSLWILGKTVENSKTDDQKPKTDFANWLAIIAASSIGLLAFSRGASFDIILTFPITASLVGFFVFDQSDTKSGFKSYLAIFCFYFFIGVALLAKGLIGIVFPFTIVAFYHLLSLKLPSKFFIFSLLWGTFVSLIVASAWYFPMYQVNGWKFIDEFIVQHHFQRYTSNKYFHPQPFWFFWVVLPLMTFPWIPFFFGSIWTFLRDIAKGNEHEKLSKLPQISKYLPLTSSPIVLFSVAWMLVPIVFFSVSGSKLPGYILPSAPAAILMTAVFLYGFVQKSHVRKNALLGLAFATFFIVLALLQFAVPRYAAADSVKGLMAAANERGFASNKVLNFHTSSHNAEFYASGRIVRTDDGKIKKFLGVLEIIEQLKKVNGESLLVLVPVEWQKQLSENEQITADPIDENGDLAIYIVKLR